MSSNRLEIALILEKKYQEHINFYLQKLANLQESILSKIPKESELDSFGKLRMMVHPKTFIEYVKGLSNLRTLCSSPLDIDGSPEENQNNLYLLLHNLNQFIHTYEKNPYSQGLCQQLKNMLDELLNDLEFRISKYLKFQRAVLKNILTETEEYEVIDEMANIIGVEKPKLLPTIFSTDSKGNTLLGFHHKHLKSFELSDEIKNYLIAAQSNLKNLIKEKDKYLSELDLISLHHLDHYILESSRYPSPKQKSLAEDIKYFVCKELLHRLKDNLIYLEKKVWLYLYMCDDNKHNRQHLQAWLDDNDYSSLLNFQELELKISFLLKRPNVGVLPVADTIKNLLNSIKRDAAILFPYAVQPNCDSKCVTSDFDLSSKLLQGRKGKDDEESFDGMYEIPNKIFNEQKPNYVKNNIIAAVEEVDQVSHVVDRLLENPHASFSAKESRIAMFARHVKKQLLRVDPSYSHSNHQKMAAPILPFPPNTASFKPKTTSHKKRLFSIGAGILAGIGIAAGVMLSGGLALAPLALIGVMAGAAGGGIVGVCVNKVMQPCKPSTEEREPLLTAVASIQDISTIAMVSSEENNIRQAEVPSLELPSVPAKSVGLFQATTSSTNLVVDSSSNSAFSICPKR